MVIKGIKKEQVEVEFETRDLIDTLAKELLCENSIYNVCYDKQKNEIYSESIFHGRMFVTNNEFFIRAYLAIKELDDILLEKKKIEKSLKDDEKYRYVVRRNSLC